MVTNYILFEDGSKEEIRYHREYDSDYAVFETVTGSVYVYQRLRIHWHSITNKMVYPEYGHSFYIANYDDEIGHIRRATLKEFLAGLNIQLQQIGNVVKIIVSCE